jgi:xanthine dehydrogenase accessory factor
VTELGLDPRSAVVALTHDPKLDDLVVRSTNIFTK